MTLLFSVVSLFLIANELQIDSKNQLLLNIYPDCYSNLMLGRICFQPDTTLVKPPTNSGDDSFVIPKRLADNYFEFQVNSEITYRSFKHFRNNQAKKVFFQAWIMEKELSKLSRQTDSLRKLYSNLPADQKEQISINILKNENRSIVLNQEIPALYQSARGTEDRFWKSASKEETTRFQEKLKLFQDSINQADEKIRQQVTVQANSKPDTLIIENESAKTSEPKQESPPEIVYKIQIGIFKGKIPESANKTIKKLSVLRKVENYTDEKGYKVYTTGNLKNYTDAATMLNQVKQEGIKNPAIIAFSKGKRIAVNEAKK